MQFDAWGDDGHGQNAQGVVNQLHFARETTGEKSPDAKSIRNAKREEVRFATASLRDFV